MRLKIKDQYVGMVITRFVGFGNLTFDYYKVIPEFYVNYYNNGFKDIFELVENKRGR